MPRPTAAQLAYGSATVVFSTLALLLLSQTRTGVGIAVIAIAALALGLLVALTAPLPGVSHVARRRTARRSAAGTRVPAATRTAAMRMPRQRPHAGVSSETRVSEHSR
ncbi:hypothetical protein A6A06_06515 [Streptomyces sp. CB02923]|uniref:hypothetical protein n=1 Tax=Streptomyces sp. CB02923 TaxID=1718985 RepID=UPI00093D8772|nr:hypothetical protein [Streptomyces sp. CB02923]OKI04455.1 hypothetical protein A6A06_06515 [Streptomyces sp. CB02923]